MELFPLLRFCAVTFGSAPRRCDKEMIIEIGAERRGVYPEKS